jgi:FGGY-family pentulose kinase
MLVAAVDVGTGSARAGLFDPRGRLVGRAEAPLETHHPGDGHAEQSSGQIWRAAAAALRAARAEAAAAPEAVRGLSFDATCSLVLADGRGSPVGVSAAGGDAWDTILWLDHRAAPEALECTASRHPVLAHAGGVMSPEMQIPKLMWLKRHRPAAWARAGFAFDLADFLTWRATGNPARSQCTLTCKWGYLAHETPGWPADFLAAMDLADLLERTGQPAAATPVGADLGPLTPAAAAELGLTPATRVAAGLIDAHAGALGVLGHLRAPEVERNAALIGGTSSCVMAFGRAPRMAPGVWGPYLGAVLPDLWMIEGGQSASGALLDHILRLHGLAPTRASHDRVIARVQALRAEDPDLAPRLHVLPDFHGNRTPLAAAAALGVISGLPLDSSFDALCRLYWRTCVGLALGLRQVVGHLAAHGTPIDTLHVTGGHTRNPLLMELYADATLCRTMEPFAPDAVLLGTAMVAATGCGLHPTLVAAGAAMHQGGATRAPDPAAAARTERDWRTFLAMQRHRDEVDRLTAPVPGEVRLRIHP